MAYERRTLRMEIEVDADVADYETCCASGFWCGTMMLAAQEDGRSLLPDEEVKSTIVFALDEEAKRLASLYLRPLVQIKAVRRIS